MPDDKEGCLSPAGGVIGETEEQEQQETTQPITEEKQKMTARVGYPAPDFEANAFHQGTAKQVRLSDFKGEWIVLCFYPGDFTFV